MAYCDSPCTIIEAGCYDGAITRHLCNYASGKLGFYAAFECDNRSIQKIKRSVIPSSVVLVEKALGAFDGEIELYVSDGISKNRFIYDCASSTRKPKQVFEDWPEIRFRETYTVPCITLDTFCSENNIESIDLIWADIQGAEKDMIQGASKIISNTKFLFLEHSEDREWYEGQWTYPQMVNEMKDLGFDVYDKFENDVIFYNTKLITL